MFDDDLFCDIVSDSINACMCVHAVFGEFGGNGET